MWKLWCTIADDGIGCVLICRPFLCFRRRLTTSKGTFFFFFFFWGGGNLGETGSKEFSKPQGSKDLLEKGGNGYKQETQKSFEEKLQRKILKRPEAWVKDVKVQPKRVFFLKDFEATSFRKKT